MFIIFRGVKFNRICPADNRNCFACRTAVCIRNSKYILPFHIRLSDFILRYKIANGKVSFGKFVHFDTDIVLSAEKTSYFTLWTFKHPTGNCSLNIVVGVGDILVISGITGVTVLILIIAYKTLTDTNRLHFKVHGITNMESISIGDNTVLIHIFKVFIQIGIFRSVRKSFWGEKIHADILIFIFRFYNNSGICQIISRTQFGTFLEFGSILIYPFDKIIIQFKA